MVGIKTWFTPDKKTTTVGISNNARKWMGRASMFLAGFIMLTPHRIAMTCAPHILKRYHLPPDVVPLFIYKIHSPIELSGLIGQLIANITAWICRWAAAHRRVYRSFSIVFTWLMFFSGVLSFILLYSGSDYGYFDYFFWSIILMTFTNGLYCTSAFKLEGIIASMYGAGIPSSGFFTFFLHKYCKWKSKRDNWEDFDRNILLIQYWVTVITLFLSSAMWTVDIGMDIADTQDKVEPSKDKTAIDYGSPAGTAEKLKPQLDPLTAQYEVKLEKTDTPNTGYKATPDGTGTITPEAVNESGGSPTYKCFKHDLKSTSATINRMTIHGQIVEIPELSNGRTIDNKQFVYVYFEIGDANNKREKPLLICLSKNGTVGTGDDNKWYQRTGTGPYTWNQEATNFSDKNPENIDGKFAQKLGEIKNNLNLGGTEDVGYPNLPDRGDDLKTEHGTESSVNIHIEKTAIGYNSTGEEITNPSQIEAGNVKVFFINNNPKNGFKRYMHKVKSSEAGKYKKMSNVTYKNGSNSITLNDAETNVKYVHVYYAKVQNVEKPLLMTICKDNSGDEWKYFKNDALTNPGSISWSDETELAGKNPENAEHKNHIIMHLDMLNDKANGQDVIHIEKTDEIGVIEENTKKIYKTGSDGNTTITVSKSDGSKDGPVPDGYVRYAHTSTSTFNLDSVKHNGVELNGIPEISDVTAVYVYYKDSTGDPNHEFPLIVCVKKSNNQTTTYAYHKRGNRWTTISTDLDKVDPDDHDPQKEVPNKGINKLFDANQNDGHAADWSPISMLACSLGTVYFFYPSISPYSLVDSVIGKKIDLWVQFTAAIPNFGVAILDIIEEIASVECGPSKHWNKGENSKKHYYLWHLFWLAVIPYLLCIYIFMTLLHFPDGFISKLINGNPIVIGLIGNTFNFFQECLESIGFAGAGAQGGGFFNDDIAAFNVLYTYVFMIISMVIRDLFMGHFRSKNEIVEDSD